MDGMESYSVTTLEQLAAIDAQPLERVLAKELDYVNEQGRAFIAADAEQWRNIVRDLNLKGE